MQGACKGCVQELQDGQTIGAQAPGVGRWCCQRPYRKPTPAVAEKTEDEKVFGDWKAVLKDPLGVAREVAVVYSFRRGSHICQLRDKSTRKVCCQATDRQFGGKEAASRAIAMLSMIATIGASDCDLRRIKQSGKLYGVSCGAIPNT